MADNRIIISGYSALTPTMTQLEFEGEHIPVASLTESDDCKLTEISTHNASFRNLDRATQMAISTAREAKESASWPEDCELGVNIASSRGLTSSLERAIEDFQTTGRLSPTTSPLTTSGNLSSSVLQSIGPTEGFSFSHSMTCSSALFAIANASAWLNAGMCERFIAGGAEAAITPFTIAQMRALGIYSPLPSSSEFPCRPCALPQDGAKNTFVLGEGAALFALQKIEAAIEEEQITISPPGYGHEKIKSLTGMSTGGDCFVKAMKMAINNDSDTRPIDIILLHAPGTYIGDRAELTAIRSVFKTPPYLFSNKCLYGHTFGSSGALSVASAINILQTNNVPTFPYDTILKSSERTLPDRPVKKIMVNSAGFGGVAVSVILSKI